MADTEQQGQSLLLPDYARRRIPLYGEIGNCFRGGRFFRRTHVRRFGNGLRLFLTTDHRRSKITQQ